MIRHIVCHKYNDKAEAEKIRPMLLSLKGKVPSLKDMEVGVDVLDSKRSYHLCAICTFDDLAGLNAYKEHPAHVAVRDYIHSVMESSVSVDFEV
ncbi:MAG: Dabb family protein [Clostridia bacterium]|nr:Dabb family protein [Clostridia bacterium]